MLAGIFMGLGLAAVLANLVGWFTGRIPANSRLTYGLDFLMALFIGLAWVLLAGDAWYAALFNLCNGAIAGIALVQFLTAGRTA